MEQYSRLSDKDIRKIKAVAHDDKLPYVKELESGTSAGVYLLTLAGARKVVLKYRALYNPSRLFRFNMEVKIGKKLRKKPSPYAIPVLYSWKERFEGDGVQYGYVVMPYIEGKRLDKTGKKNYVKAFNQVVKQARELYHVNGIAPGDLLPTNIMVKKGGKDEGTLVFFDYDRWLPSTCMPEDDMLRNLADEWAWGWLGKTNRDLKKCYAVSQRIYDLPVPQ